MRCPPSIAGVHHKVHEYLLDLPGITFEFLFLNFSFRHGRRPRLGSVEFSTGVCAKR